MTTADILARRITPAEARAEAVRRWGEAKVAANEVEVARRFSRRCPASTWDGNADDPSYAYCGRPLGHAGDHGSWEL